MPDNIIPSAPSTSGPTAEQKTNDMNTFIGTGQMADAASRYPTDTPVSLVNGQTINDLLNQAQTIQAQTRGLSTLHQFGETSNKEFDEDAAFANINKKIATDPTIKMNVQKNSTSVGAGDDLERYKQSKHFNTLGYTPGLGEKQEFKYGDVMTWGETMGKAVGGAYELGKATFIEGFKGWGRMVESLATLDLSKLMGSEQERYDMAKEQQEIFDKYAIYDTKESKEGSLWNRQFFGSMLQQSGFALGAGLQMAVEGWLTGGIGDLLEIGLASSLVAKTGKTAAEVRELAGVAERTSAIGKGIERVKNVFSKPTGTIGEALNDARKTADVMTKEKGVAESLAKFTKSLIPFYETGEEIAKLNKAGAGTLQLVGAGLGGIKRSLSEFNMARSESIYEAASTYKQLQDKLVKEYTEKNGEAPYGEKLEKIRQSAENASHDNFWTNVGVLSLMNKIEFDNMFKSFNGTRQIFSEGAHALEEHAFDVAGKVEGKMVRKAYTINPYFGKLGALGDISKTFGGKKAAWEATKIVGGKFLKIEGSEGVQELLQNASDQGLEDYYYDLYHGQKGYGETRLGKVMDGFTDQLHTIEGAKTFIMGALTGALLSPLYKGIRISTEALNDRKQLKADPKYQTARQQAIESVGLVNAFYSGDKTAHMKEWIANVKIQNKAAETMEDAARNHDKYTFYNAKDTAFNKMIGAAIKLNMFESVRDSIKELGDTLKTDEEFKQAFDMEPTKENRGNAKTFMHKIANDLEEYHETHTRLMDKYADIVIPKLFKNNTLQEQADAKLAYEAVHQAIGMLTFNVQKAKQTVLRNVSLKQEMSSNPHIGSSAGMILTKAGGQTNVEDSIKMLNQEIKQMTSGGPLTDEQRTLVSQKVEEVGHLKKWADVHHDVELGEYDEYSPEHLQSDAYKTFMDLINFYNKQNKISTNVSKQDAESVFISMLDFMKLNRDNRGYVDAVNLLSDPNNMDLIMRATASAIVATNKVMTKEHLETINKLIEAGEEKKEGEETPTSPTATTYTIKEEADGSFTVVDSEGKEITKNLATKDDAQELIDSLNKQATKTIDKSSSPALEEIRKRKQALEYSANQLTQQFQEKVDDLVSKGATQEEAKNIVLSEMSSEDREALKKLYNNLISVLGEEKTELTNISNILVNERGNNKDVAKAIVDSNNKVITLEDLDKIQKNWNDNNGLTDVIKAIDDVSKDIKEKENILKDFTTPQQYLDEDSNEFKSLYNDGLDTLSKVINKPNVKADEIKTAFDHFFDNVVIKLDPSLAARNMYKKKHKEEMEALIQKANLNAKANDVSGAKQSVTNVYSKEGSLNESAEDVFNILNNGLNPEHKAEVVEHFEQSYLKNIARKISNLIDRANGILSDGIHSFLKKEGEKRVLRAEKELNNYKEEATKLKESIDGAGIKLNVEHNEDYSTSINRSIQYNDRFANKPATLGQSVAIDNLLRTGILTEEDLQGNNRDMMVDASSIINIGSARIATIELNKLANEYIKEKSATNLKNLKASAKQYLTSIYGNSKEALEIINDLVDGNGEKDEDGNLISEGLADFDDVDTLLGENVLNVPKVKKLLTNEQYALLATFKKNLFQSQIYGNILNVFNTISDKESEAISNNQINAEDFITVGILNSIPDSLFQKDSENKSVKNSAALRDDILSLINTLDTSSKDEKEVNKLIESVSTKYFSSGSKLNGMGMIQAYVGAYLSVKTRLSTTSVTDNDGARLSEEEMLHALNNSKTTSLSKSQIASVDEFAKTTLLDAYKEKLNAAIGYTPQDLNYSPEKLSVPENPTGTFSSLREKDPADIRTADDLIKAMNAVDNKVDTKTALQFVMNSEFATDAEKELASNLLVAVQPGTTMALANNSNFDKPSAGDFDPNTNEIRINMDAVGHKEGYKSVPLETVILHELIHQLTESALEDPNSEFAKGIKSLINAVKNVEGVDTFYAFQKSLSSDEQLREFVAEALTNPSFQYLLAKTPYANSKMSVWDKLMDIINKVLSAVGVISGNDSALSEVLSLTGDLLNPANPSHFGFVTETMQKVNKAKSLEELNQIKEDLFNNREKVNDDLYNSLKNSIDGKEKSIRQQQIKEELKGYDVIKINKVTYHYQLKDTGLTVFKVTRNATKTKIKDPAIAGSIIEKLLSEKGVRKLLSKRAINDIMREAGDPMDRGSYASGEMDKNGAPIYETRYPEESEVHINLPFEPGMFAKFTREFWAFKKSGKLDLKLDYLKKEYGVTAVANYGELASKLDRDQINNLVRRKWISTEKKMGGFSLEDHLNEGISEDRLFQMYHDVLAGINIDDTDYKAIRKTINSVLKTELGVDISDELQTKIENKLFYEDIQVEEDAPINEPVEPGEEPKVVYTKEKESDNIADYKINEDTTAKQDSALRSYNPDNFGVDEKTGELKLTNQFKKFYYKVRNVINALSVKDITSLKGYHVTMDKDDANLRWDGSAEDDGYKNAEKGVLGYISDDKGNPLVFDSKGNMVGTLDKNNLSDHKGLNNGENQIVYFTLMKNNNEYTNLDSFKDAADLKAAREKVMNGNPQIGRLINVSQGQMNLQGGLTQKNSQRKRSNDNDFSEQLNQDHVSITLSPNGRSLVIDITGPDGAVNREGLYPPNINTLHVNTGERNTSMFDYIIELMQTYRNMAESKDPNLLNVQQNLKDFLGHILYKGNVRIGGEFYNIEVNTGKKDANGKYITEGFPVFKKDANGNWVINDENFKDNDPKKNVFNMLRNYINRQPLNIDQEWLSGKRAFMFPIIKEENGKKIVTFVEKDYRDFLLNEVGFATNIRTIPAQKDIERNNSMVHFESPKDLSPKTTPIETTNKNLVDNPSVIKETVKEDIKNANTTGVTGVKNTSKKKFRAPVQDEVFDKTCK